MLGWSFVYGLHDVELQPELQPCASSWVPLPDLFLAWDAGLPWVTAWCGTFWTALP
jgi:hypothetical protein